MTGMPNKIDKQIQNEKSDSGASRCADNKVAAET